jgi:hypothetical protein
VRAARDHSAWWAHELHRPLVNLTVRDEVPGERLSYLTNYPMDMPADTLLDLFEPAIAATHYYGDAFPAWWVNCGPGIGAGFMGADVHSVREPSETVWFSVEHPRPANELELRYDEQNAWWQRVQALTAAMVERWHGLVQVGQTDIGGNLDILASFRGTQGLLYDLLDCPEVVQRLASQATQLWLRYYDELDALIRPACPGSSCWAPLWSPGKTYMLQSDFAYMLSPAMFERFVLPDLYACCEHLDHAFYHLDGKGQIPHLDLLLSIPRLRGVQWIPGDGQPSPDQWLPLLKRIRDGGKLCQVFVRPEGARRIVRNLGGRGFLLVIQHEPGEFRDPEQAKAFLDTLAGEDVGQ